MFMSTLHASALGAALLCCGQTQAQTASSAAVRSDPLDAKASVPLLRHESSFAQYRRLSDEKLISWREANDTVARIGGWRVYAREAQQPEPMREPMREPIPAAQAMPPASSPQRMAPAHGGHKAP